MILDGKIIADTVYEKLKNFPPTKKFLAGILVGENSASSSFVAQKKKAAEAIGLDFRVYKLNADISTDELRREVGRMTAQKTCGGLLVQLPLPGQINTQYILNAIPRDKDVDVLGERTLGAFYAGRGKASPPSVGVVEEILKKFPIDLSASVVAVVGAGKLIGKPIASWLLGRAKELIVLEKGSDLSELKNADLIILGAGVSGLVKGEILKEGAGVIDFGYSKNIDGKISGDLDTNSNLSHLNFYTPTPGGTGPILVAKLLENFYKLNS